MVSNWVYSCLAALVFCGVTVNWLSGSAVIVSSWQMLRRARSPTVVVELVSFMLPAGFETHNPSEGAAADPRLRPRGHRDDTQYDYAMYRNFTQF